MDLVFYTLFLFSLVGVSSAVIEYFSAVPISPHTFYLIWKLSADVNLHKSASHFKIKSEIERDGENTRITETLQNILSVCKEHVGEHGVTICSYNTTFHRPGKDQHFQLEFYESKGRMLSSKDASAISWYYPPSLRVVDTSPSCIKLLIRTETSGTLPNRLKIELKSDVKNAKWIEAPETIDMSKPQNLYSAEFCVPSKPSISASKVAINSSMEYLFRFKAFYESTFTFMGKNYTIEAVHVDEAENLWCHVLRENEQKIVFPVITVHIKNGWFLNFTLPNITKKNDIEDPFRLDYKVDRFSRPFNWISVPKKYLGNVVIIEDKVSINLTELAVKKRLLPDAEFRLYVRKRTSNGWVWSQPSYSYKFTDKPNLLDLKPREFKKAHMFLHRLVAVGMILLIATTVGLIAKFLRRRELLEFSGFSYRRLDAQQEGEFV